MVHLPVRSKWSGVIDHFFIKHHFKRYLDSYQAIKGLSILYPGPYAGLFPWIMFLPAGSEMLLKQRPFLLLRLYGLSSYLYFLIVYHKAAKLPAAGVPAVCLLIASGMAERGKRWWQYSNSASAVISFITGIAFLIARPYLLKYGIPIWTGFLCLHHKHGNRILFYIAYAKKSFFPVISAFMLACCSCFFKSRPIAGDYLQGSLYSIAFMQNKTHKGQRIIAYA